MMNTLQNFAATNDESIFGALGIDFKMLILQAIGFAILVWLLGKYIFPILLKQVDERQSKIEESTKAAVDAEKNAAAAEKKIEATLKEARTAAADIVAIAKTEATQSIEKAEAQAKARSERIVAEAHEELQKDVLAARKTLEKDTIDLVRRAASLSVASLADDKLDTQLVKKSVEGARK